MPERKHYPLYHFFFFFNDTATTEIYTLSLHDALPISTSRGRRRCLAASTSASMMSAPGTCVRSEEHTSELQSRSDLVCRLLLEKKKESHKHPLPWYSSRLDQLRLADRILRSSARADYT